MDFLKGMTAFGGILALLGWLKEFLMGKDNSTGHEDRAARDLAHIATRRAARSTVGKLVEDYAKRRVAINKRKDKRLKAIERYARMHGISLDEAAKKFGEADEGKSEKGLIQKGKEKITNAVGTVKVLGKMLKITVKQLKHWQVNLAMMHIWVLNGA
jgi:hypothetical protein